MGKYEEVGAAPTTRRNSPVTQPSRYEEIEEEQGPGFLARLFSSMAGDDPRRAEMQAMAEEAVATGEAENQQGMRSLQSMMQGASDTASLGAAPLAERLLGGAVDMAGSAMTGNNQEMTYGDFVKRVTGERNSLAGESPGFNTAGALAGAVGTGLGVAGAGLKAFPALAKSGWARIGASGAYGGAETALTGTGTGDLTAENAVGNIATGAALGAGGQAIGEALAPLGRFARSRTSKAGADARGQRQLAHSLMDEATGPNSVAAAIGKPGGMSPQELRDMTLSLGNGQQMGEYSPLLRSLYGDVASTPEATGKLGPTVQRAEQRLAQLPGEAQTILDDALINTNRSVTGREAGEAVKAQRTEAAKVFREVLDGADGRSVPVMSKAALRNRAATLADDMGQPVFDKRNMSPTVRNTLEGFRKLVTETGDVKQKDVTLKALHNIRMDIDKSLGSMWADGASSADKSDRAALLALKKMVSQTMSESSEDFAAASAKYAETGAADRAFDLGSKLMRGTNTNAPVEQVREYATSLTAPELGRMQDGALEWLQGQLNQSDTALRKLAQDNPDMMGRVKAIFGDDVDVEGLATALDNLATQKKDYTRLAGSEKKATKNALPSRSSNEATGKFDKLVVLLGLSPRHGVPVSAARRVLMGDHTAFNRSLFDLLQESDPKAAALKIEELIRLRDAPNAGLTGGAIGGAVMPGLLSTYDK